MSNPTGIEAIGDKGFETIHKILRVAQYRQKVLSSNIANADTPGYRSKDIASFGSELGKESAKLQMAATDPGHITPKSSIPEASELKLTDTEPWEDQNNVELDVEVSKMTENSLLYETGVRLISTRINEFNQAVKGR